jgi:hypothetical protein
LTNAGQRYRNKFAFVAQPFLAMRYSIGAAMDLLGLLEIDRSLITPESRRSLLIAEMVWSAAGYPQDRAGLCAVLEKILRSCTAQGIWYAPVLLQRKKAIERGTWRPLPKSRRMVQSRQAERSAAATPGQMGGQAHDDQTCSSCGGSGILTAADGKTGTFCPCGAYLARVRRTPEEEPKPTSSR